MLGPVQKAKFKNDLLNSTAQYKIVVSQDPIQQFFVLPYDRWEGYGAERSEILNFIRNNGIDNVAVPDHGHARERCRTRCSSTGSPTRGTIANEMVTGPIATTTFQNEVIGSGRPVGLFAVNAALNLRRDAVPEPRQELLRDGRREPPAARPRSRPRTTPAAR